MSKVYKKPVVHIAFLAAIFTSLLISGAFSEVPLGKGSLSASFYSKQRLVETDSKLNPNNVFCVENGFYGTEAFTLGYAITGERVSLRFNDFGSIKANNNPDGSNCIGELYGSLRLGEVFLDIGKKRINQSLSYFKSPINFVLDNYEQYELNFSEGRIMANLDFFTNYGFIGVSYIPKIDFNSSIKRYASSSQVQQGLLRYDVTLGSFTMGFAVSKDDFWRIGTH
ncbi:MAG TPA: hypothetical protein GXZ47_03475, partial [Treponema sp.]|nr:hypothetical protein [Treponema sp.]